MAIRLLGGDDYLHGVIDLWPCNGKVDAINGIAPYFLQAFFFPGV